VPWGGGHNPPFRFTRGRALPAEGAFARAGERGEKAEKNPLRDGAHFTHPGTTQTGGRLRVVGLFREGKKEGGTLWATPGPEIPSIGGVKRPEGGGGPRVAGGDRARRRGRERFSAPGKGPGDFRAPFALREWGLFTATFSGRKSPVATWGIPTAGGLCSGRRPFTLSGGALWGEIQKRGPTISRKGIAPPGTQRQEQQGPICRFLEASLEGAQKQKTDCAKKTHRAPLSIGALATWGPPAAGGAGVSPCYRGRKNQAGKKKKNTESHMTPGGPVLVPLAQSGRLLHPPRSNAEGDSTGGAGPPAHQWMRSRGE